VNLLLVVTAAALVGPRPGEIARPTPSANVLGAVLGMNAASAVRAAHTKGFPQGGPPTVPIGTRLHISWNQSPIGAGSSMLAFGPEQGTWQWINDDIPAYMRLATDADLVPSFLLNTPGGYISTGLSQSPRAPWRQGFILTNSNESPLMLEYTCPEPVPTGWGRGLVITITSP
jgi:hypothetical protein